MVKKHGIFYHIIPVFKRFLCLFAVFLFFSISTANYKSFLENLRYIGIDVDSISQSKSIDRYELARLLNGVNCKDCVHPDIFMTSLYTYQWWGDFSSQDGKDFDDIVYLGGNYKGQSYYYCVAYVGDNNWMRGYPYGTSPICNGKFCGARTTTLGEFLQVVLNIADQYVYKKYLVDWKNVKSWMDSLQKGSYADTYLTESDKRLINDLANSKIAGELPNEESFQPYLKYCMFNLDNCGMQSFGVVGQGYWPVGELNILYDNNIVEYTKYADGDVHELVDGKFVLETLYNLFNLIDCDFDYDYDCDDITNTDDNCPNYYNPTQTDTDGDGIGDVCDDDIDGDGVKNPIGIVDDLGNIIISKYVKGMDNCIFVVNQNQLDSNKNGIGDACEDTKTNLGMYIKTSSIKSNAPVTVEFQAITQGSVKGKINRTFGDGTSAEGKKVSHTFEKDGLYSVQATAEGYGNNAQASTTVLIGRDPNTDYGLQIIADKQTLNIGGETSFKINKKGDFDKFQWNFGDGKIIDKNNAGSVSRLFRDEGNFMITVKGFKDGQIVAVANTIIGVGDSGIGSSLSSSNVSPSKGEYISLKTLISGFDTSDISSIEWDMGDEKHVNTNLNWVYSYQNAGTYVIVQTINLKNGIELQNFLTIHVGDSVLEHSYAIETDLDNTIITNLGNINFSIKKISSVPTPTLVLNTFDDGSSEKIYDNLNDRPKNFDHKYYLEGIFSPKTTVFIDECVSLDTTATVVVNNGDSCLQAFLNGTLSQFGGDLDGDGIPDICDDDIDGDGYPNLIGLVNQNNTQGTNLDDDNINPNILKLHKGVCQLDNCPTVANKNQLDLNNNGWGDDCDNLSIYKNNGSLTNSPFINNLSDLLNKKNNGSDNDSDGDGILDSSDLCPELPENYNGVQDFDGCPEIGASSNCSLTNYNYVNRNFSVYPVVLRTGRLTIFDPKSNVAGCIGDSCKTLCLGNVNNCESCNGLQNCNLCRQHPEFCGNITGGTGPYTITAWQPSEHRFYIWNGITNLDFSFTDILKGDCPCKKYNWFAKDINGLVSNIGKFFVCSEGCVDENPDIGPGDDILDKIIIYNPDDLIPPCNGNNCSTICTGNISKCPSCNGDIACQLCRQNPGVCGSWTGGTGPFQIQARCEDKPTRIYTWNNITNRLFSFAEYFEHRSKHRDCHRIVQDSKGLISNIGDFVVYSLSGTTSGPTGDVNPSCIGGDCNVNECSGNKCNNCTGNNCLCVGNIQNCPRCPNTNNPMCNSCLSNPGACGCRSGWDAPVSITARCDSNPNDKYVWTNVSGQCLSFENSFINNNGNSCNRCHWYLTDKWGDNSNTIDFDVCGSGIQIEDPAIPVFTCTGDNCNICEGPKCNDVCVGNIEDCNSCNGDKNCEICKQNPDLCGVRSGGTGPYEVWARCDDNLSNIYKWNNVSDIQFSFTNIWTGGCPCRSCNWKIKDSNGLISTTGHFQVCAEECYKWINPIPTSGDIPPAPNTGNNYPSPTLCTGDVNICPCNLNPNCTSCTGKLSSSASWTGNADGPFELSARCDDDPTIYTWSNISGYCFDLSEKFQGYCKPRSCHWKVSSSDGLHTNDVDFTIAAIKSDSCIIPFGPEDPVVGCIGNDCNNVCIGDIQNCPCENNPSCSASECTEGANGCGDCSNAPTAAKWNSIPEGPFNVTARCPSTIGINIHVWTNIENSCLNLNGVFEGDCPCKTCFWYVETSDGAVKSTTQPFQVCNNWCQPNPRIEPEPNPTPIPPDPDPDNICTGDVNKCPCNINPNCTDTQCKTEGNCPNCSENPETSATWTGTASGPFTLSARCDDDPTVYTWSNISGYCFNLSGMFQGYCGPRSCHWKVSSSDGLTSKISDFVVDNIDSDSCIIPFGPEDPVVGCTGNNCDNVCIGDIQNCPCENNPSCSALECTEGTNGCGDCSGSRVAARWESKLIGPFTITVVCDGQIKIWSNINNYCIGLDDVLPGSCPCKTCRWSVSVKGYKKTIQSPRKDFSVCGEGCEPEHRCGDGIIDEGENCHNCLDDLRECIPTCGDGEYGEGETCNNCPQDLMECPGSCGNGEIESPEECDNGVQNGKDGLCSEDCKSLDQYCGNGKKEGNEECDYGKDNGKYKGPNSCTDVCTYFDPDKPRCGNGEVDEGENCENCEIDLVDACLGRCGDFVLNNGEECDHGEHNGKDGECTFECKKATDTDRYCGNSKIERELGEECDLGSMNGISPLCNSNCRVFPDIPVCGNGIIDRGEECDYGGLNGKDGINCDNECKEKNTCGNGKINPGEDCDNCPEDLGDRCKPDPDTPPIISDGPEGPVVGCSGYDCNNCNGDIMSCSGYNTSGYLCSDDQISPESNGIWTGGIGPYSVTARCENNPSDIKHWYNISGQCFPFEKYFEGSCPCNLCHRFVQDVNGETSDILDFTVCNDECNNPEEPPITPGDDDGPITTPECLSCPCIFTDYGDTLNIHDDVKAVLFDYSMNILYGETIPVGIMQYLD